jgi:hypothetical protein
MPLRNSSPTRRCESFYLGLAVSNFVGLDRNEILKSGKPTATYLNVT